MENNDCEIIFDCFFKTHCPLLILNNNGFPVAWNDAIDDFLIRNHHYAFISKERNFWDAIKQMLLPEETERLNAFIRGDKTYWEVEIRCKHLDSQTMWYKLEAFPVKNGKNIFCLIRDNTNLHVREMHLMEEKQDAERAVFSKTQFLANMSHEIRTPIQTIVGTTDLLDETPLNDEQRDYVNQIKFGADLLLSLINDILDFSKMEAGQLVLEKTPFNLETQVEKTLDLITLETHKKHLDLILDIDRSLPLTISGDPWRLNQILLNLIKNAVKFTAEGSVTVKVFPIHRESGLFIEFRVIDTGVGISDEHKKKLFTTFYQGDVSTTRKYGGTGLGLSICKNLVDMMNGDISCESNAEKGSTFRFAIPALDSVVNSEPRFISPNGNMPVLIVDDNKNAAALLEKRLHEFGFKTIHTAASGAQALEMLQSAADNCCPFRIAFIDMIMPNMDGWRLSAEINKNKQINDILLYLMMQDGIVHQHTKEKILEWFNGYFYKPIKRRQLTAVIESIDFSSFHLIEHAIDGNIPCSGSCKRHISENRPSLLRRAQAFRTNAEQHTAEPIHTDFSSICVLIAEDHPVNRRLLKTMLNKIGVSTVAEAENGREAVTAAKKYTPDIIFMDLQMPEMNGFEASLQLRKDGFTNPIIACTASVVGEEFNHCYDCGMNGIMLKPFKKSDIIDMLQQWRKK